MYVAVLGVGAVGEDGVGVLGPGGGDAAVVHSVDAVLDHEDDIPTRLAQLTPESDPGFELA